MAEIVYRPSPPATIEINVGLARVIDVAMPGPRGPKGEKGDPGTSMVLSVNGKTGDVVLNAPDVNADPEGAAIAAASSAMVMHLADPDPHGQYVADGDVLNGGNF